MLVNAEIRNSFNRHAAQYEHFSRVQQEIGRRLFERLSYLKNIPTCVLDLGCGTGYFSQLLQTLYPKAQIVGVDIAHSMLTQAKIKQDADNHWSLLNADMRCLPFDASTFDLVFANQVIHWSFPMQQILQEINRVMSAEGCLMFSTLGPDTFIELKQAFSRADPYTHVNDFVDLHIVGDCLLQELFIDPVVDRECLTAHYSSLTALLSSLKAQGVRNVHPARNLGLTGRSTWRIFTEAMAASKTSKGDYPLSYEVIYGHAWKGTLHRHTQGTQARIPISMLRRPL